MLLASEQGDRLLATAVTAELMGRDVGDREGLSVLVGPIDGADSSAHLGAAGGAESEGGSHVAAPLAAALGAVAICGALARWTWQKRATKVSPAAEIRVKQAHGLSAQGEGMCSSPRAPSELLSPPPKLGRRANRESPGVVRAAPQLEAEAWVRPLKLEVPVLACRQGGSRSPSSSPPASPVPGPRGVARAKGRGPPSLPDLPPKLPSALPKVPPELPKVPSALSKVPPELPKVPSALPKVAPELPKALPQLPKVLPGLREVPAELLSRPGTSEASTATSSRVGSSQAGGAAAHVLGTQRPPQASAFAGAPGTPVSTGASPGRTLQDASPGAHQLPWRAATSAALGPDRWADPRQNRRGSAPPGSGSGGGPTHGFTPPRSG